MKIIDLHVHSTFSDGMLFPEEIVLNSINKNCKIISITDHDTINDYRYLEEKYKIKIVSGIEFNTGVSNLHILGYGITNFDMINEVMIPLKRKNEKVCFEVIKKMENDGYNISVKKIIDYMNTISINCDIMDKRKIVKYLINMGYSKSILETYKELIGAKTKYYVPNKKISPEEIINLIKISNGIAVLAHPNTLNLKREDLIKELERLKNYGLGGIEIINCKMGGGQLNEYNNIANKLELIETIGSDFHNPNIDNIGIEVEDSLYKNIEKKLILREKS